MILMRLVCTWVLNTKHLYSRSSRVHVYLLSRVVNSVRFSGLSWRTYNFEPIHYRLISIQIQNVSNAYGKSAGNVWHISKVFSSTFAAAGRRYAANILVILIIVESFVAYCLLEAATVIENSEMHWLTASFVNMQMALPNKKRQQSSFCQWLPFLMRPESYDLTTKVEPVFYHFSYKGLSVCSLILILIRSHCSSFHMLYIVVTYSLIPIYIIVDNHAGASQI